MKIKELREKGKNELMKLLKEVRVELVKLRLDRKVGSLADGSAIGKRRKEIAKILTVLKEKEILEEAAEAKKVKSKGKKESPPLPRASTSAKAMADKSEGRKKQNAKKKA